MPQRLPHVILDGVGAVFFLSAFFCLMSDCPLRKRCRSMAINTSIQKIQFISFIIGPQVFFSGLISLDTMSVYLRWIRGVTPLTYGAEALRNIMIRGGAGWDRIWMDVVVLAAFTFIFMILNILALQKHRKI